MGAAIGAAVSATPTMPLHNLQIFSLAFALRANPLAGVLAGLVVSNPLTFGPQYYLAWKIGDLFFPGQVTWEKIHETFVLLRAQGILDSLEALCAMGLDTLEVMLTGGVVMAIPTGVLTYLLTYRFCAGIRR